MNKAVNVNNCEQHVYLHMLLAKTQLDYESILLRGA